jgi:hypothetical protein
MTRLFDERGIDSMRMTDILPGWQPVLILAFAIPLAIRRVMAIVHEYRMSRPPDTLNVNGEMMPIISKRDQKRAFRQWRKLARKGG